MDGKNVAICRDCSVDFGSADGLMMHRKSGKCKNDKPLPYPEMEEVRAKPRMLHDPYLGRKQIEATAREQEFEQKWGSFLKGDG